MKRFFYITVLLLCLPVMHSCNVDNLQEKTAKVSDISLIGNWELYKTLWISGSRPSADIEYYDGDGARVEFTSSGIATLFDSDGKKEAKAEYKVAEGYLFVGGIAYCEICSVSATSLVLARSNHEFWYLEKTPARTADIYGKWDTEDGYSIIINKDGTGREEINLFGSQVCMDFRYTYKNGTLTFEQDDNIVTMKVKDVSTHRMHLVLRESDSEIPLTWYRDNGIGPDLDDLDYHYDIPLSYDGDREIYFAAAGGTEVVTVQSTEPITVTSSKSWVKVSNEGNNITFTVGPAIDESTRKATVTVTNNVDPQIEFTVKQEGGKFNFAPADTYNILLAGGSVEIPYETNYEFELKPSADWIVVTKNNGKVVVTVAATETGREGKVEYVAGPNSGEFAITQSNPVEATFEVFLQEDVSQDYYKFNSVWFNVKGSDIVSGAKVIVPTVTAEVQGDDYYANLLKTDSKYAIDAAAITKINGVSGYTDGFFDLQCQTSHTVFLLLSNGSSEKLFKGSVETENNPDPIQAKYSEDELYYMDSPVGKIWDIYSNGGTPSGTSGQVAGFGKRIKLGSCTFTVAGRSSLNDSADSLTTNGMIKAMTFDALDLPMTHHFVKGSKGGTLYFEAPYINFPSETANQFYELCGFCGYAGSTQPQTPLYPLLTAAGKQDGSVVVYVDGGFGESKGIGAFDYLAMYIFLLRGDITNPGEAELVGQQLLGVFYDMILIDPEVIKTTSYVGAPMNYYAIEVKSQPRNYVEFEALVARNAAIRKCCRSVGNKPDISENIRKFAGR